MKCLFEIINRYNLIFFFITIMIFNNVNSLKGKNNQFDYNFSVIINKFINIILRILVLAH
jgi:hypothetical protein